MMVTRQQSSTDFHDIHVVGILAISFTPLSDMMGFPLGGGRAELWPGERWRGLGVRRNSEKGIYSLGCTRRAWGLVKRRMA